MVDKLMLHLFQLTKAWLWPWPRPGCWQQLTASQETENPWLFKLTKASWYMQLCCISSDWLRPDCGLDQSLVVDSSWMHLRRLKNPGSSNKPKRHGRHSYAASFPTDQGLIVALTKAWLLTAVECISGDWKTLLLQINQGVMVHTVMLHLFRLTKASLYPLSRPGCSPQLTASQ